MGAMYCPNFESCQLCETNDIVSNEEIRESYIINYCKSENERWQGCKRLITKQALNFCPDFVLPDTDLSIDEIMDKFDNENID